MHAHVILYRAEVGQPVCITPRLLSARVKLLIVAHRLSILLLLFIQDALCSSALVDPVFSSILTICLQHCVYRAQFSQPVHITKAVWYWSNIVWDFS